MIAMALICGCRASVNWEDIKLRTLEKLQELLHLHPDVTCPLQCTPTASEITPLGYLSQSPFNFFALALFRGECKLAVPARAGKLGPQLSTLFCISYNLVLLLFQSSSFNQTNPLRFSLLMHYIVPSHTSNPMVLNKFTFYNVFLLQAEACLDPSGDLHYPAVTVMTWCQTKSKPIRGNKNPAYKKQLIIISYKC